ncbi:dihydropteroate synthase [Zhihengliuella flava]|uniref:Dihydropteroate synthase n=1 Tax=Zhihengliuella flava TaxID=1285193 RepID=A0A931DB06_9MICC|nr:dihydropteroate synthase [Zhihengliuella flava]
MFEPPLLHPLHHFGHVELDFSRRIAVMAIVNRTPDSFYDAGRTFALDSAVAAALTAVDDGADWVDIGGVPFAPGPPLDAHEEADRIVPVIQQVRSASPTIISADTFLPAVAERAIEAGADVINDTTGLAYPELARVVADAGVHLVLTHSLAKPRTVYARPAYSDVVTEIVDFLRQRIDVALHAGIAPEKIIIDPGHDLNKNTLHTLEITRRFSEIAELGYPALAAVSNKDFIGETLDLPKPDRTSGSLAAATMCALGGARIVRMHSVTDSVHAMRLIEAAQGWREPAYLKHNMGEINEPAHQPRDTTDA